MIPSISLHNVESLAFIILPKACSPESLPVFTSLPVAGPGRRLTPRPRSEAPVRAPRTCERTGEAAAAATVGSSSDTRDAGGGVSGGFDGDPLGDDAVLWRKGVRSLALGRIGAADAAS
ncbi:unnamed protein product [Closterium sp. NIES-54]